MDDFGKIAVLAAIMGALLIAGLFLRPTDSVETVEPVNDICHERPHEKRLGATKTRTVEHLLLSRSFYDPCFRLAMITEG